MANKQIEILAATTAAEASEPIEIAYLGGMVTFSHVGDFTGAEKATIQRNAAPDGQPPVWVDYTFQTETFSLDVETNVQPVYLELGQYRVNKEATTNAVSITAAGWVE